MLQVVLSIFEYSVVCSLSEDPCLINVRHFAKTVRAMRRAGYKDVKGKLYPGMRHEILNEIGREQVYHDIAVYMRKKGF